MGSCKRPRISRNGARLCPFQRARSLDLPFLFASSRKGEGAFRFLDQTPSQSTSDPDKYLLRETDGRLQRWKGLLCKPAQRSVKRRRKARHRRARSRGEIRKGDLPKPDFSGLQCCASVVVGLSHLLRVSLLIEGSLPFSACRCLLAFSVPSHILPLHGLFHSLKESFGAILVLPTSGSVNGSLIWVNEST